MDSEVETIFKQNSTSYYYSSLLFPKDIREDVFKLYSYVRKVDDFVDELPQEKDKLERYRELTIENWETGETDEKIVNYFLEVARKNNFEKEWAEAFLHSMEMDTYRNEYGTMDETLEYIRGSAEVIGLMMVRILDLEEDAEEYAELLGRSMQYCNFLRDIEEDRKLGRRYIPEEKLEKYGIESLEKEKIDNEKFERFMGEEIQRYFEWQSEAEKGLKYIPYRVRVPVILSSRIYKYTAKKIREDPMRVFDEKVRPSKPEIFKQLIFSIGGRE